MNTLSVSSLFLIFAIHSLHSTTKVINSTDDYNGWPRLQRQVLHDLVIAATRLSNNGLATRHMTFLLQTMWHHMTPNERLDAAIQLKKLAELCEGSPVPLVLDNGFVIPPANLLNIPQPL